MTPPPSRRALPWRRPFGYGLVAWGLSASAFLAGTGSAGMSRIGPLGLTLLPSVLVVPLLVALVPWLRRAARPTRVMTHVLLAFGLGIVTFHFARTAGADLGGGWAPQLFYGAACYSMILGAEALAARWEERRRWESALAHASDVAMRAQLNPHFLFNTIHAMTALVRHTPDAAIDAMSTLGGLLRYVLEEGAQGDVPLRREWAFVEGYLKLEQLRLGERLAVDLRIDPETLALPIPSLCLQPLVENAVRHGIAPTPAGGRVTISVQLRNESLVLRVSDNGRGADASQALSSPGLGLRAIRERLAHRYRGTARLDITTTPGHGFIAVITLPVIPPSPRARHPDEGGHAHRR